MSSKKISSSILTGLLGLIMVLSPLSIAYGDDGRRSDLDSCRNSQIVSYSPASGTQVEEELQYIEYIVSPNTHIPSLEAYINGKSYPVQYRQLDDETYRARVVVPSDIEGSVYVAMGAQSQTLGSCDNLLHTSFVIDTTDSYNDYGVSHTVASYDSHNQSTAVTARVDAPGVARSHTNVSTLGPKVTTNQNESRIDQDDDKSAENRGNLWVKEIDQASSVFGLQAASMIGGITGILPKGESCNTLGSSWPWYAWLGIIWIALVLLWLVIVYTLEPQFGEQVYASRLAWTVTLFTVLSVGFWWMANPCYTHLWVPICLCIWGASVYWLYSEEYEKSVE